jgi:hypothetical protein
VDSNADAANRKEEDGTQYREEEEERNGQWDSGAATALSYLI